MLVKSVGETESGNTFANRKLESETRYKGMAWNEWVYRWSWACYDSMTAGDCTEHEHLFGEGVLADID